MRLLGGLGLLAPVAFLIVLLAAPRALDSWSDDGTQSILAAVATAAVGVWLTLLIVMLYVVIRYRRLIKAAEQLAAGTLGVTVRASERGRGLDNRLARAINTISAKLSETTDAAQTDKLTGVANRRALLVDLFNEVERANRYERPLSVAFVDIDHFKAVNDTYGHQRGDAVLQAVAYELRRALRDGELIYRLGGEEFLVLLPGADHDAAIEIAERVRGAVTASRPGDLELTLSAGVASAAGDGVSYDDLFRSADVALFEAKRGGRDRVVAASAPPAALAA